MDERLEAVRADAITKTFNALAAIVEDSKADMEARLKAAKLIDGISDTMVHAFLIQNATHEDASTKQKMLNSIDKLNRDRGHGEDR